MLSVYKYLPVFLAKQNNFGCRILFYFGVALLPDVSMCMYISLNNSES